MIKVNFEVVLLPYYPRHKVNEIFLTFIEIFSNFEKTFYFTILSLYFNYFFFLL